MQIATKREKIAMGQSVCCKQMDHLWIKMRSGTHQFQGSRLTELEAAVSVRSDPIITLEEESPTIPIPIIGKSFFRSRWELFNMQAWWGHPQSDVLVPVCSWRIFAQGLDSYWPYSAPLSRKRWLEDLIAHLKLKSFIRSGNLSYSIFKIGQILIDVYDITDQSIYQQYQYQPSTNHLCLCQQF